MFAPRIEFLTIHESHEIHANFLENFSNVRKLYMIIFLEESTNYKQGRFITWSRLLYLCSNLTRLALSNSCIEVFSAMRRRNIRKVLRYLDDPNCVDQQFEKLEYVEVIDFEGTPCELNFLKLILAYSPSLSRMIIESSDELDGDEVLDFYEELTMFVKASPRVDLIVLPHGPDVCRGEFDI
ncbi:hypothetical protein HAX54_007982 [Datura stramonium]|uniref:FBD domain-containing protein n=1 Tax=Datura stramonium TaxID=4076 RepID=A0ABS8TCG3_DATST|nr:hypothetical protein [Datura stramonium]